MTQMQGIVSILRSDNPEKAAIKAAPLRRTLSADMSSKKWFADNGLPVLKKIASSEQIAIDSSSSSESSDEEECEVIGKDNHRNIPTRTDIWTAIMSQKKQDDSGKLPPPYVHPLVKKSASSLSEKSLKVCTESLGSETGSDVFSLQPSSEKVVKPDDQQEEKKVVKPDDQQEEKEEQKVVKLPCLATKKPLHARSFPPPLPSLAAARTDGASLHMHSRRVNGRLVLEAVAVQQQKYFEAQRQDGRFLLTLINDPKEQQPTQLDLEEKLQHDKNKQDNNINNINEKDEDDKDIGISKNRPLKYFTTPAINVHKSTVTIKRIAERDNENPSWSRKIKTKQVAVDDEEEAPIARSLPPRSRATGLPPLPPPTGTTSFNSYQYFWRVKPSVASVIDPMITQHSPPTKTKDLVLMRGNKADCFLPSLKGCKEPRRSLVMWEPFCIATS